MQPVMPLTECAIEVAPLLQTPGAKPEIEAEERIDEECQKRQNVIESRSQDIRKEIVQSE